jgi:very-short-patch-repair endonuclease
MKANEEEDMTVVSGKGGALLRFLRDTATLRRQRIPAYGSNEVLWFADVPKDRSECRSPFLADEPGEFADIWLEVRKARMPGRPPVPESVVDWVRPEDLDQPNEEPELLPEITVLVEKEEADPDAPPGAPATVQRVPETRRLTSYPEVEDAWLDYLVNQWEPWAQAMRRWQEVHRVYESVDFMRRRLEEAEERYELLLGVGLLQWRDSVGTRVERHLLTAPAEIELDAARGILTVVPAASFERFRIELDMLEPQDQPRLDDKQLEERLEDLDVSAWDAAKVGEILRVIANRANPDAQVEEETFERATRVDGAFRVFYAPALILRERRPTAFEEVVTHLLDRVGRDSPKEMTEPWKRFLAEGDSTTGTTTEPQVNEPPEGRRSGDPPGRLLFPLPTNDEQRQIVCRLQAQPFVLVKGPPGTGKSLTIANLICHLLAHGERVLVTAEVAKGLRVLRGLLPEDVQALCVTALGSTREDQRLLEEGVRGILRKQSEWRDAGRASREIERLEDDLQGLENELAQTERRLRECREAETHSHTLLGGYEGTAARIAKRVEKERERFGWCPQVHGDQPPFPLTPEEVRFLAETHTELTESWLQELCLPIGDLSLPDPDDFRRLITDLEEVEREAERTNRNVSQDKIELLRNASAEALKRTAASLDSIQETVERARYVLGDLANEILKGLLVGHRDRWYRLAREVTSLLARTHVQRERLGTARVVLPRDVDHERMRADAERRLEHFEQGGRRGVLFLIPRVVRETRYVEEYCQVDGRPPRDVELLGRLVAFLKLEALVEEFKVLWPAPMGIEGEDPRKAATRAAELTQELQALLRCFDELGSDCLPCVPVTERAELAAQEKCADWLQAIETCMADHRVRAVAEPLDELLQAIRDVVGTGRAHACLSGLADAVERRDVAAWRIAWEERKRTRTGKERLSRYEELVGKFHQACPELKRLLDYSRGDPAWKSRILRLEKAWMWASARNWVRQVSNPNVYEDLVRLSHRLQAQIEKKTEELAALRAWHVFFKRLDDATVQNLRAWTRAVDRIGKGTGKFAYRHRRTARRYLMECIPKIPAWVMPLHKLWDTVDAVPGLFDTVIVDEASQAGINSLALFLLARRVVVVGDDKQNSPEGVGVREDDVARLVRQHLADFRFRDEFRPDTSLFDHAERSFGNLISLREHFRCVPEIIRFSNDLCYTDAPLIPLRQAPPKRLPPLVAKYVPGGVCEGEGQRIRNRAEAEAIVEAIRSCLENEAYEGKTMGVIALQGHGQAELIANRLAEEFGLQAIQERRLRCGVPATFQGDERDVIFLSMVIAPNIRFRTLGRLPDQRRFNVAMSRARDQVWLFHSVQQHDLSPECLRRRLLRFFQTPRHEAFDRLLEERERLEREARRLSRRVGEQPEPYESWFEVDVALELLRRNYAVRPQYNVAGYRIDLVVVGIDTCLAVECDGDAWHGPERYDRDMARQRQLERADWTFVRIRESEFYADKPEAVRRIMNACEELGIQPRDQHEEPVGGQLEVIEQKTPPPDASQGSDTAVSTEIEATDELANPEYGPFTGYSDASAHPDPREASGANVRSALRRIIERDGPLTRASIYRLYVEGCPHLHRAGRAVRQSLNRVIGAMLRSGEIVQEDELGDRSAEKQVIRLAGTPKVRERPAGRRDLLEIPLSELRVVLDRLETTAVSTDQDDEDLLRRLLEHYGYTRLTKVRRMYLDRVLQRHRIGADRSTFRKDA